MHCAFNQQRSRKHSPSAGLRAASLPLLRRAGAEGHLRYPHSAGETHVCHIKHAPFRHHADVSIQVKLNVLRMKYTNIYRPTKIM